MNYCGKAEAAAKAIVAAFEMPDSLPEPMAEMFFHSRDDVPCRRWSHRNQMLVALRGTTDARSYRQWLAVGRNVKAGEKAFFITAPVTRKRAGEGGAGRKVVIGFRGVPVFGYHQTEGDPLPAADQDEGRWVESLPLVEVALQWGLDVRMFNACSTPFLGRYCRRKKEIMVGVKNLGTWVHELVHAADDRLGNLTAHGCRWTHEVVAELGASVLLRLLDYEHEADLGGCHRCVQYQVFRDGLTVAEACWKVMDRTCAAVKLILDTAEAIRRPEVLV